MEHIDPKLLLDYERWEKSITEDPYENSQCLGILDVLKAHYLVVDFFATLGEGVGGVGPRNINLLHSAMHRQHCGFEKKKKWSSIYHICATLFYGLIEDHPFHDANKRTAFVALLFHLWKIGKTPTVKRKEFEELAVRIASKSLSRYKAYKESKEKFDQEVNFIADFLRRTTRDINRSEYLITYNELDKILDRYDYFLVNPENNKIDVMHRITYMKGLFRPKPIIIEKRVRTIGFPGWKKQVSTDDIRKVRRITDLNPENGIDSETFFGMQNL